MIRISKKQVIAYHAYLIERFGGMLGIRDEGMLASALSAAFATFDGDLLYPDPRQRAAKLEQGDRGIRNLPETKLLAATRNAEKAYGGKTRGSKTHLTLRYGLAVPT